MRATFAHDAVLEPAADADRRAPGGAVTVALCGALDHDPPCRLAAHYTAVEPVGPQLRVHVLFASAAADEAEVRRAIDHALATGEFAGPDGEVSRWSLISSTPVDVPDSERDHALRLAAG